MATLKQNLVLVVYLLANVLVDWDSILGRVIAMTQEMVPDTSLLNTQHYKGMDKG